MKSLLFVLLLTPFLVFPQKRGSVIDKLSGEGIPNVNVKKKGTSVGTSSNQKGVFITTSFKLGDTLKFSHLSYVNQEVVLDSFNIKIYLTPSENILPEAKIYAKKENIKVINNPWIIDYCILNDVSLLSLQVSNEGNVLKLIQSEKVCIEKQLNRLYDEVLMNCTDDIFLVSEGVSRNVRIKDNSIVLSSNIETKLIKAGQNDCLQRILDKQYFVRYANNNKNALVFCYNWKNDETKLIYQSFDLTYFKFLLDLSEEIKKSSGHKAEDDIAFLNHLSKQKSKIFVLKIDSKLIIIDNVKDKVLFFDKKDTIKGSVDITFPFKKTKIKYIKQDKITEQIYYFIKENDKMNVYELNTNTGVFTAITSIKPFIEKPTVYNGVLYYLDYDFRKETRELYKLPL